ncbi:PDGLE domain-containing protein [Hydrogenimonas sp.]
MKKMFFFLAALTALVPLGLLSENPAWGEWENAYYEKVIGFIPAGISEGFAWKAPIPDYAVPGMGEVSGYYLSALVGIGMIFAFFLLARKALHGRK